MNPVVEANQATYFQVSQFLGYEAMLLDQNRYDEWLALLDDSIIYEVPIRLTDSRGAESELPSATFRVRDDIAMLKKRIERIATGEAWAENPPSRTVRVVGSIAIEPCKSGDLVVVNSAILVHRQRGQDTISDLIPARRQDIIRVSADRCALTRRTVILGETVLKTPNLGIFL